MRILICVLGLFLCLGGVGCSKKYHTDLSVAECVKRLEWGKMNGRKVALKNLEHFLVDRHGKKELGVDLLLEGIGKKEAYENDVPIGVMAPKDEPVGIMAPGEIGGMTMYRVYVSEDGRYRNVVVEHVRDVSGIYQPIASAYVWLALGEWTVGGGFGGEAS